MLLLFTGQVLKENGLDFYDEYELLMLADGRCAQDDYYLVPVKLEELPEQNDARFFPIINKEELFKSVEVQIGDMG